MLGFATFCQRQDDYDGPDCNDTDVVIQGTTNNRRLTIQVRTMSRTAVTCDEHNVVRTEEGFGTVLDRLRWVLEGESP